MFRAVGDKLIQDHFACPINNQIRSAGSLKFQWNLITGPNHSLDQTIKSV
jgi:hypothetical protein